ncbi:MAG: phosphotransferase [Acidimicrobiales bacterium]
MEAPHAPLGVEDLTPQWLSAALAAVSDGAAVTAAEATRVGNGMVSDSIRLRLSWDRAGAGPLSVVAKVPSAEATSRAAAAVGRTYEIEAAFYRELAATVAVHRPRCHLSLFDPATQGYAVLLEDLAPAQPGNQLTGCSVEEAEATIPELAALHSPRWADDGLLALGWLDRPNPDSVAGTAELLRLLFPTFLERYSETLAPGSLDVCQSLIDHAEDYLAHRARPWTVTHGDFRLDNLLFGGPRVAVLDWQTVKAGPALSDVSYFIGSALQPSTRREIEEDLVREYHSRLAARGIDLPWSRCWDDYRRYSFDGVLMGIAASVLVGRTERGDAMFMAMVNRHAQQVVDLDAEALMLA